MLADVSLGSNLGDRLGHLQAALDGLVQAGCEVIAASRVYETAPVGGPPQGPFLNAVVRLTTSLDPRGLLALAQHLEMAAGRVRGRRWGPRTLDVDILRCGDVVVSDPPDLVVPHPRMHERAFVLVPLSDVDPDVDLAGVDVSGVDLFDAALRS